MNKYANKPFHIQTSVILNTSSRQSIIEAKLGGHNDAKLLTEFAARDRASCNSWFGFYVLLTEKID